MYNLTILVHFQSENKIFVQSCSILDSKPINDFIDFTKITKMYYFCL